MKLEDWSAFSARMKRTWAGDPAEWAKITRAQTPLHRLLSQILWRLHFGKKGQTPRRQTGR